MSENGIMIGGDFTDGNILWGNRNTVMQINKHVYYQANWMPLLRDAIPAKLHLKLPLGPFGMAAKKV